MAKYPELRPGQMTIAEAVKQERIQLDFETFGVRMNDEELTRHHRNRDVRELSEEDRQS